MKDELEKLNKMAYHGAKVDEYVDDDDLVTTDIAELMADN